MSTPYDSDMEPRLVEAFVVLQLVGGALFLLILVLASIAQHRGASRHSTFFSFCLAWIIFCVSYALLAFAGQQISSIPPNHWLCIVQTALVYGAPPLASSATVCLVTHLMLNIKVAFSYSITKRRSNLVSILLVIAPWVTWLAVTVGVLIFSIRNEQFVMLSPNGTFCVLVQTALPKLTSVWATLASVVLIAEEIFIGVLLYRNRERIAGVQQSAGMAVRVVIFTIGGITAVVIAFYYVTTSRRGGALDVLLATLPVYVAVVFGSQKDILSVLAFWERRNAPSVPTAAPPTMEPQTSVLSTMVSTHETTHLQREEASCGTVATTRQINYWQDMSIVSSAPTLADHGHGYAGSGSSYV
jgi:hypothetical protein